MSRLFAFILMLSTYLSLAQWSTTEVKNGKHQIYFGTEKLKNTKFDSVVFADEQVATAYKKNKIHYVRKDGKRIKKYPINYGLPFKNGLAIILKKSFKSYKQKFGAINDSGTLCIDYVFWNIPKQYGRFLYGKDDKDPKLYAPHFRVDPAPDSISYRNDSLFLFDLGYVKSKFNNTRSRKSIYSSYSMPHMDIYDGSSAKLLIDNVYRIYHAGGFKIFEDTYDLSQLYDQEGQLLFEDYFDSVSVSENIIYTYHYEKGQLKMAIRNHSGKLLKDDLILKKQLTKERIVIEMDSLQYIMNADGVILTDGFAEIGQPQNGWIPVYGDITYSYINDTTYDWIGFEVPLVVDIHPPGSRKDYTGIIKNRIGNFKKRLGNFGRSLIGGKKKTVTRENPRIQYDGWLEVIEPAYPFEHGFAKICVTDYDPDSTYTNFRESEKYDKRKYNFINEKGQLLNEKQFREVEIKSPNCLLGKVQFDWMVLDSTGKSKLDNLIEEFEPIAGGYFIGHLDRYDKGRYVLFTSDYELFTDEHFKEIIVEDQKIIGETGTYPYKKVVLVELE